MAKTSELDRVTAIVLRFMRGPILLLIVVYAIAIIGLVLIPGQDAEGNPTRMSFFHAFYFLTYTATTTGFGEIPYPFTNAQRLWAIVLLYGSVVAWIYAISSIIRLVRNPHFQQAVALRGFARSVGRITEPFFVICGFGDTGSLLTRGLDDAGCMAVIIDEDEDRIKALSLRDYRKTMPGLCADASAPKHLIDAGVKKRNCQAVVALTDNEDVNIKITVMARLLNPSVRVICLATLHRRGEYLDTLGTVETMDPFDAFAKWLGTALYAPLLHTLKHWLIGAQGFSLDKPMSPPKGVWILCGYGRMGQRLRESLHTHEVRTTIIDPDMEGAERLPAKEKILGYANADTLRKARIVDAAGVVAATDSDSDNLGILLAARSLNPEIYMVVRQNHHENELAFSAANADLIMQPSLITARNILFDLLSPLIHTFLDHMSEDRERQLQDVISRLWATLGSSAPHLWTATIRHKDASAVTVLKKRGYAVTLGDIVRNPLNRERNLACIPLVLKREDGAIVMPDGSKALKARDQILFCSTRHAQRQIDAILNNEYALQYLITGVQEPRGYVMKWFARRWSHRDTATLHG
ncbi:MAG: hypothetical protein BMS9Abin10_0128 [Gammaproteobacteria bacterium]|nr:MAG: hypothetical protein BMS9Abin10_0128 [Gammaproteobacteria bacterium]